MQVGLLSRAVDLLKPGGRIVYSTCSLDPVENEAVVSQILQRRNDLRLIDCSDTMDGISIEGLQSWVPTDDHSATPCWEVVGLSTIEGNISRFAKMRQSQGAHDGCRRFLFCKN